MTSIEAADIVSHKRSRAPVPGYASVLLRADVREALRSFRDARGFIDERSIERCLVTAGLDLLINNPHLHELWMTAFSGAARRDAELLNPLHFHPGA